jgi:hypothetical protein
LAPWSGSANKFQPIPQAADWKSRQLDSLKEKNRGPAGGRKKFTFKKNGMDWSCKVSSVASPVIIVSGLPRSGTSLMMQLLAAAAVPLMTDQIRSADQNNPRGYFEYEPVKGLMRDNTWLSKASGKGVKVISQLIPYLPPETELDVLMMERPMEEVIQSQVQMLQRLQQPLPGNPDQLQQVFQQQQKSIVAYLQQRPKTRLLQVSYNQLVAGDANEFDKIIRFLGIPSSLQPALRACVDPSLYRAQQPAPAEVDRLNDR